MNYFSRLTSYCDFYCDKCLNNKICIYAYKTDVSNEVEKDNLDEFIFEITIGYNGSDPKQIQFQNNI